jgi:hypothetical protein
MLHIFRGGKTVAGSGQAIEFNAKTIAQIAASYNAKCHEAPIVVGHPTDNGPAFGWVKRLVAKGLDLYAEPDQMNPDFLKAVQQGAYKKISSSFYCPNSSHNPTPGNYHLRHVGFLGAMAPAIKGLGAVVFSDASDFVSFTEDYNMMDFEPLKSSLQSLFDLIGPAMPDVDMGPAIEEIMMAIDGLAVVEAEEETPTDEMLPEYSERLAALVIREKAFEASQEKAQAKTIADFCEAQLTAGRMTNGEKTAAIKLLTMAANATADYAEGDKSPLALAMESYSNRTPIVPMGEKAKGTPKASAIVTFSDGAVDSTQLVSMAKSMVAKNPDLSLEAAMEQIMEAA